MKRIFWSWKNLTRWHFKTFISCFFETLVTIPERIYTHEKVLFNPTYFKLASMPYSKLNRKSIKMPSSSYGIFQQMKSSDSHRTRFSGTHTNTKILRVLHYLRTYVHCTRSKLLKAVLYNVPWTAQFSSLNSQNPIFVWFFIWPDTNISSSVKIFQKNIFYLVQWDNKRWR